MKFLAKLGLAVMLIGIGFYLRRAPRQGFNDEAERADAAAGRPVTEGGASARANTLRVPSSARVDESHLKDPLFRSQVALPQGPEARLAALTRRRGLATVPRGKDYVGRDMGFRGRGLSRFKLLEGYRAFPGGASAKVPAGYRVTSEVGPYRIAEANTPELKKSWAGAPAQTKTAESLPVLVNERENKLYVVTGTLNIRLKEFNDANVNGVLEDFALRKIGSVEGIGFLEAAVADGADVFEIQKKLDADPRVMTVDLDFFKPNPRLK